MALETIPALTFDDVLLRPGHADFYRSEIDLSTQLTSKIALGAPLVSSPMDTVTEGRLAIGLAELGGIGIIHRNLKIEDQAQQVAAVKAAGHLVGAAIGSSDGYERRVERLLQAGADVLVIDSAHGDSKVVLEALRHIKHFYSEAEVIAGNIATGEAARRLIDAGADGLRVGMGPGAICTTRIVSGMGVPQLTAILETAKVAREEGVPVIADGGINQSGDIVKAIAAGASSVMMGRLFAGTYEAPGDVEELSADQVPARFKSIVNGDKDKKYKFKRYRGMGSVGAMKRGNEIASEDEFHGKSYSPGTVLYPEGVDALVESTGDLAQVVSKMLEGLRSGMYDSGNRTIFDLRTRGVLQVITNASLRESHPHDIYIDNQEDSLLV